MSDIELYAQASREYRHKPTGLLFTCAMGNAKFIGDSDLAETLLNKGTDLDSAVVMTLGALIYVFSRERFRAEFEKR